MLFSKTTMVAPERALPGRATPVLNQPTFHTEFGTRLEPAPAGSELAYFGLGCFWGAEKLFWNLPGVTSTAVGYMGGYTENPTYEEVCSGRTGHAEVVRVAFDPTKVTYETLVRTFFEAHDPTQGMRQGNDVGTQYRSVILTADPGQAEVATEAAARYERALAQAGYPGLTTDIEPAGTFYFAEGYHQQYLAKNPAGYCPVHSTGVTCPAKA
ncbi:MAG: peptide-methionine (S)-S-oxide reductase MsrA [Propionibacteriaceae bacterium]|nr:peptide-methionine (S)-S-oxide reductase MsrA [Micropruina sp.]